MNIIIIIIKGIYIAQVRKGHKCARHQNMTPKWSSFYLVADYINIGSFFLNNGIAQF